MKYEPFPLQTSTLPLRGRWKSRKAEGARVANRQLLNASIDFGAAVIQGLTSLFDSEAPPRPALPGGPRGRLRPLALTVSASS